MIGYLIGAGVLCVASGMLLSERSRDRAIRDIESERENHFAHGYDAVHDDEQNDDELVNMASAYLHPDDAKEWWPFDCEIPESAKPFDPKGLADMPAFRANRRRKLVIAASLICAEIDRMDRETKTPPKRITERQFQLVWLAALVGLGLLAGVR